ncbi:unnamed protein product [Closterium sp. NIES-53]
MVSNALSFSGASLHAALLKSPTSKARSCVESHRHLPAKLRPTVDPSPALLRLREKTSLHSSTFLPASQLAKETLRDVKVPAFSAAGSDLDGEHLNNGGEAEKPDRQSGRAREGGGEDRPSKKGETAISPRSDGQTDPFTYGLRWIRISTAAGLWLALFFASCLNRDDSGGGGSPSTNFPLPGRTRGGSGGGNRKFSSSSAFTGGPDS